MSRSLLIAILLTFGFAGVAHADKKVDWSQYLESPSDRPAVRTAPAAAPVAKANKAPRAKTARVARDSESRAQTRSAKVASTKAKRKPARRR